MLGYPEMKEKKSVIDIIIWEGLKDIVGMKNEKSKNNKN